MLLKRMRLVFACLGFVVLFCGCPDYSHLREVPDYENMVDDGGGLEEENNQRP